MSLTGLNSPSAVFSRKLEKTYGDPKVIHDGLLPEDPDALSAFSAYPQGVRERIVV
jgi:hypothetical protein